MFRHHFWKNNDILNSLFFQISLNFWCHCAMDVYWPYCASFAHKSLLRLEKSKEVLQKRLVHNTIMNLYIFDLHCWYKCLGPLFFKILLEPSLVRCRNKRCLKYESRVDFHGDEAKKIFKIELKMTDWDLAGLKNSDFFERYTRWHLFIFKVVR